MHRRMATVDHVVPLSRGGPSEAENLVIACYDCNQRKSNMIPEEAGMPLTPHPIGRTMVAWRELRSRNGGATNSTEGMTVDLP
jgi:5-methylcytosine-specific restriction endonuclease McrA